jgi:hypothetical protein
MGRNELNAHDRNTNVRRMRNVAPRRCSGSFLPGLRVSPRLGCSQRRAPSPFLAGTKEFLRWLAHSPENC